MSLLPPTIMRALSSSSALRLQGLSHGLPTIQAFPEGGSIKIFCRRRQADRYEEIAKWSKKDAEAMPLWDAWMAGLADVLGPLRFFTVPPNIGSRRRRTCSTPCVWPGASAASMSAPSPMSPDS